MSQESLLGMGEAALRRLLEATLDLAERRRIRSAIRELQRQELEQDEETLASKRFRPERRSHRQDDKENWPRSQCLEEEQQVTLAALSQQLKAITDVEELTKLLRAAGEYEERKLIRAAIRKLRAEEIEAAALAGNVQHGQRDSSEPCTGDAKSSQRDDAETPELAGSRMSSQRDDTESPALARSGESGGKGSAEALATDRSTESSQRNDAEQPALAGLEERGHAGAGPPAQEPQQSVAHEQDDAVEQEHGPAGMQELCSQQAGDPQQPSAQAGVSGTLVLLELQPTLKPSPEPEDGGEEPERGQTCSPGAAQPQGQHQAAWKEGSPASPAAATELRMGQSQAEQPPLQQPSTARQGSQLAIQVLGPAGRCRELPAVAVPTQDVAGTPAGPKTHQWEQVSSMRLVGRTASGPPVTSTTLSAQH